MTTNEHTDKLIDESPVHNEREHKGLVIVLLGVAAVVSLMALSGWLAIINERQRLSLDQPVQISVCSPADFDIPTGTCAPSSVVDPDADGVPLVLDETLSIPVRGRVLQNSDRDVSYQVTVYWVAIDETSFSRPGERFPILDAPIVWEAGRNETYEAEWKPTQHLLTSASSALPGEDLGRWRIVGEAIPTLENDYLSYQWDSVKTFRLVAPS